MYKNHFRNLVIRSMPGLLLMATAQAGTPVWTFSAPSPANVEVSDGGIATVQYTVTNQSNKPKNLILNATTGLSASACYLATRGSTCTLTLTVNGSTVPAEGIHIGPVLCEQSNPSQCYQPSIENRLSISKNNVSTTSLQTSVSELALSVTGLIEYGIPAVGQSTNSGAARTLTITNTGAAAALNVTYTFSPALPSGTTISPISCGTIAPSDICVLTITPGAIPSAAPGDMNPVPITLNISGSNTNTLNSALTILTYGSVYQDGYVFALDDTAANTGSVDGKVVTTTDRAAVSPGIVWSSNGASGHTSNMSRDLLPGIDEISTSSSLGSPLYTPDFTSSFSSTYTNTNPFTQQSFSACNGAFEGQCNTKNILAFYNKLVTNYNSSTPVPPKFTASAGPTNLAYYAAGLCSGNFDNHADWYLPAICEMGYAQNHFGTGCGVPPSPPTLQNIQSSLVDYAELNLLTGFYWSSTEGSNLPLYNAWAQSFASSGGSGQFYSFRQGKGTQFGVRCSRALTH